MAYDFSGYATKNDLKCGDGRTIKKDAFKDCDGQTVPLVWQHVHNEFGNVLGHVLLENREDGVYCYGSFNDTPEGQSAKEYVKHGDIKSLSIYANKLVQRGGDVVHGMIREVSLVLAGANPGAMIDNISIAHSDGSYTEIDDEAIIYSDLDISYGEESVSHSEDDAGTDANADALAHEDKGESKVADSKEKTVQDVIDGFTDEQKEVVNYLIGVTVDKALEEAGVSTDGEAKHDDLGDDTMKQNVFDRSVDTDGQNTLSHAEMDEIFSEAISQKGSLKETFLAHGITRIDYLFPESHKLDREPQIINDDQAWVSAVMTGVHKSPFSRLKTMAADITIDEARALGYVKGTRKAEEQFGLLKREVTPQTIYKLQKFDRDDILDITDIDVVAWVKREMQIKLKEEIARAILIGDGRANSDPHKIKEEKVIPIYKDVSPLIGYNSQIGGHNASSATFAYRKTIEYSSTDKVADKAEMLIDDCVRARIDYKGSGSPTMYIGPSQLAEMLLIKDSMGRRIYESEAQLATAMRVSKFVEVPAFDNISRVENDGEENEREFKLAGIVVNLADYTIGMDKGGETTMFDDFDIDFNKYTYLLETRLSGMLTKPFSAIILEFAPATSKG
jgi:HK97 family phage prohead protease